MSTVDVSTPPRRPVGAAGGTGGQFVPKLNSPPEGTLTESATGSFLYPPERFDSLAEYLDFFENAPISDQVLSNASYAYRAWRQKAILAFIHERHEEFVNTPGNIAHRMAAKHGSAGLEDAINAQRPQWKAEAEERYPLESLPRSQARSVLRAHQIVVLRGMLPQDEEQSALEHLLPHRDVMVTASDLADYYATTEWAKNALTESDYAQAEAMGRVASLLAQQQGITDYDDWH